MRRLTPLEEDMPLPTVASVPAATALEADRGQLVDLRGSSDYRKAHVAGARWSIRPRLGRLALAPTQPGYLIGAPDVVALAAKDTRAMGLAEASVVAGGQATLEAAGAAVVARPDTTPPDK